jgi:hypothetical protein
MRQNHVQAPYKKIGTLVFNVHEFQGPPLLMALPPLTVYGAERNGFDVGNIHYEVQ